MHYLLPSWDAPGITSIVHQVHTRFHYHLYRLRSRWLKVSSVQRDSLEWTSLLWGPWFHSEGAQAAAASLASTAGLAIQLEEELCVKELRVRELCARELCVCVTKLCVTKLCVKELCVEEFRVEELWWKSCVWQRDGGGGGRPTGVHSKKQEPHTKMWGIYNLIQYRRIDPNRWIEPNSTDHICIYI